MSSNNADVDPYGVLYSSDGKKLAEADDNGTANFSLNAKLKAGKLYYLLARTYADILDEAEPQDSNYTVTATRSKLVRSSAEIKVDYHDYAGRDVIAQKALQGTTWAPEDLAITAIVGDAVGLNAEEGYVALNCGSAKITVKTPDGNEMEVTVKVDYNTKQWLCMLFLGGWAWMKDTHYGTFDLGYEIKSGVVEFYYDHLQPLVPQWVFDSLGDGLGCVLV
jgi:hypothetical protein